MRTVAVRYEAERMPTRVSTARVYRSILHNHVLPKWGDTPIKEVQPRPVELWLRELDMAPKSKTHIRAMLGILLKYAMWAGVLDIGVNPMSPVSNPGATKRVRKPRSLRAEEFGLLLSALDEPFSTFALVCVCLGLRISEALALRWADVEWGDGALKPSSRNRQSSCGQCEDESLGRVPWTLLLEMVQRLREHRGCVAVCGSR